MDSFYGRCLINFVIVFRKGKVHIVLGLKQGQYRLPKQHQQMLGGGVP